MAERAVALPDLVRLPLLLVEPPLEFRWRRLEARIDRFESGRQVVLQHEEVEVGRRDQRHLHLHHVAQLRAAHGRIASANGVRVRDADAVIRGIDLFGGREVAKERGVVQPSRRVARRALDAQLVHGVLEQVLHLDDQHVILPDLAGFGLAAELARPVQVDAVVVALLRVLPHEHEAGDGEQRRRRVVRRLPVPLLCGRPSASAACHRRAGAPAGTP